MSFYQRVLEIMRDGRWHDESELRRVTRYPHEWIRELRLDGRQVQERKDGDRRLFRLAV